MVLGRLEYGARECGGRGGFCRGWGMRVWITKTVMSNIMLESRDGDGQVGIWQGSALPGSWTIPTHSRRGQEKVCKNCPDSMSRSCHSIP